MPRQIAPDSDASHVSPAYRRRAPHAALTWLSIAIWSAVLGTAAAARAGDPVVVDPLRVLIVGGGPSLTYNQVAIESNVRYVGKLLPRGTIRTTLFADGDPTRPTVLYDEDPNRLSSGEQVFNLLMRGSSVDIDSPTHYRKPNLGGKLDGPSERPMIEKVFTDLAAETSARPLLLYFTGHGSSDRRENENNFYDLWGKDGGLSVRDLAAQIARVPESRPVTIVMVQCFSGAFGNLILDGGRPSGEAINRDLAGFFATVNNRVAAGCTSAVNEAEYHDFTSYFFAALTGRDRVGRRVTGADYNGDGRVGMNEAYCYTLIHDESIDVPVCTSDVFLRRYVPAQDAEVFQTSYDKALSWANPAQHEALVELSSTLKLNGDDRLGAAYRSAFGGRPSGNFVNAERQAQGDFEGIRNAARKQLLSRFPDVDSAKSPEYRTERADAISQLTREAASGKWKSLMDADDAVSKAEMDAEAQQIAESRMLRFVRLAKSVILAHRLNETGSDVNKQRFARLLEAEGRTILPPANTVARLERP